VHPNAGEYCAAQVPPSLPPPFPPLPFFFSPPPPPPPGFSCQVRMPKSVVKNLRPFAPKPAAKVTASEHALRVLAADDNRTNQLVFRKMVKDQDIDLTFASNGVERAAYKDQHPAVVSYG